MFVFSVFFLACVVLRLAVAASANAAGACTTQSLSPTRNCPSLRCLVASLPGGGDRAATPLRPVRRIRLAAGKLEVKLVCEEDDAPDAWALSTLHLQPWVDIIKVPAGEPRHQAEGAGLRIASQLGQNRHPPLSVLRGTSPHP